MVKQIWRIVTKEDSLWSKWVNPIKLKSVSFWDVNPSLSDSWGWKYLLKLREKVKPHVDIDGDIFRWVTNEGKKTVFSTQLGFDPKHAFILWLAVLNRLNTQDRMMKWTSNQDLKCVFCGKVADSITHLFFGCDFSLKIWKCMKEKILYRGIPDNLPDIMQGMAVYPYSRNIWSIINRLLIAASVYFIWQERNHHIFRKVQRDEAAICKDIQNFMQLKLLTFKVKQSWAVKRAAKVWGLKCLNSSFSM
ncbi:uncharacterized protein [Rutidosis leptorrhynchoides]|uniref:uncharacterized protein n=1 Tax=Rutidosis leptorrhynchoides TaxID=125765 RepID=UPI003A9A220F